MGDSIRMHFSQFTSWITKAKLQPKALLEDDAHDKELRIEGAGRVQLKLL
jgi:hypothetical protein